MIRLTTIQLDDIRVSVEGDVDYSVLMATAIIQQHFLNKNREAMDRMFLDAMYYGTGAYKLEPDDDGIKMININPSELTELRA